MQSLLNLHSNYGLPICLSGITNPLSFSEEMADHDKRREAIKRQKAGGRGVVNADQEMGVQRNMERLIGEMREVENDEDLANIVHMLSCLLLLPSLAKAA